jgi:hypothetical protein
MDCEDILSLTNWLIVDAELVNSDVLPRFTAIVFVNFGENDQLWTATSNDKSVLGLTCVFMVIFHFTVIHLSGVVVTLQMCIWKAPISILSLVIGYPE